MSTPTSPPPPSRSKLWQEAKPFLGEHYGQRFLSSFCLYLPLVATFAFLTAVATKVIGEGYGVPLLLEHEDPGRQFFGGMFVAFLAGECLLLGWVFDGRRLRRRNTGQPEQSLPRAFLGYATTVVLSFALTAVVIVGFFLLLQWQVRSNLEHSADPQEVIQAVGGKPESEPFPVRFWLGGAAGLVLALFATLIPACWPLRTLIENCLPRVERVIDRGRHLGWLRPGGSVTLRLVQMFLTPFVLFFIVTLCFLVARANPETFYSPVVICFYFLYLLLAIYGFLHYVHPRLAPLLVLVGVILLALGGLPVHKYRLPDLSWRYKDKIHSPYSKLKNPDVSQEAAIDPDRPPGSPRDGEELLTIDKVQFRKPGEKKPFVVVVASGGGLRAAAWTHAMLERLERELRSSKEGDLDIYLPGDLRLIAGASGGMLGAACYSATVPDLTQEEPPDSKTRQEYLAGQYQNLTKDCLTPILDEMLFSDLPASFSPFIQTRDRGLELENAWDKNLGGVLNVLMTDLKAGERAGWRPSIVFSPMMIEDGRRLLISNLDLQRVVRNAGNVLKREGEQTYSFEGIEFFRRFWNAPLKLSTATRLSASFPFFSPSVTLPTLPRRRVVDAGYYDNYGVSVAASYLFSKTHRDLLLKNVSGVLLIQIRDGLSQDERKMGVVPSDTKPPNQLALALEEITSPLEGVLSARVATASYRNDGMLELLSNYFIKVDEVKASESETKPDPFFFTTVTFEYPGPASLNWYLTRKERANIRAAAGLPEIEGWPAAYLTAEQEKARRGINQDIAELKGWWRERRADKPDIQK